MFAKLMGRKLKPTNPSPAMKLMSIFDSSLQRQSVKLKVVPLIVTLSPIKLRGVALAVPLPIKAATAMIGSARLQNFMGKIEEMNMCRSTR